MKDITVDYPISLLGMHVAGLKERLKMPTGSVKYEKGLAISTKTRIKECNKAMRILRKNNKSGIYTENDNKTG